MTQDQKAAVAEFLSSLQRLKNEGVLIVYDNTRLHFADYRTLESAGYFEVTTDDGFNADEVALHKTEHVTFDEPTGISILDKWIFGNEGGSE